MSVRARKVGTHLLANKSVRDGKKMSGDVSWGSSFELLDGKESRLLAADRLAVAWEGHLSIHHGTGCKV